MNKKNNHVTLSDIRNELRYWPYTIHAIDDTLDRQLIQGRGKQLLFQSMLAENLIVFAGSGLTGSYGRLSWNAWVSRQTANISESCEKIIPVCEAALALFAHIKTLERNPPAMQHHQIRNIIAWLRPIEREIDFAREEISRLSTVFDDAFNKNGHFPGGEDAPVKFEIARQLHELLRTKSILFCGPDAKLQNSTKDNCEAAFRNAWIGAFTGEGSTAPQEALKSFAGLLIDQFTRCTTSSTCVPQCKSYAAILKNTEHNQEIKKLTLERVFLSKLATLAETYRLAFEKYWPVAARVEAQTEFHEVAKLLLVDETSHAEAYLRNGLQSGAKHGREEDAANKFDAFHLKSEALFDQRKSNLHRDVAGIRENPDLYQMMRPFAFDNTKTILKAASEQVETPKAWKQIFNNFFVKQQKWSNESRISNDEYIYLDPHRRFIVETALKLLKDPFEVLPVVEANTTNPASAPLICAPDRRSFSGRNSILAPQFDALRTIVNGMRISRFITTNYDYEIERYFMDNGFRKFVAPEEFDRSKRLRRVDRTDSRVDGIGQVFRDQTFSRETAADLVTFAIGNDETAASVFHLHGRAAESEPIVVTERDYMDLYLRKDSARETVNDAITLAFSATPILFLGLGMEEADVLRPLRQFMSDRDRSVGYTAIVLLPAEKSPHERTKMSTGLYLRYGAHTIFYGSGTVRVEKGQPDHSEIAAQREQPGPNEAFDVEVDWLYCILKLVGTLTSNIDEQIKRHENKKPQLKSKLKTSLRQAMGKTEATNIMKPMDAFDVICFQDNGSTTYKIRIPKFGASHVGRYNKEISVDGKDYLEFLVDLLEGILNHTLDDLEAVHNFNPSDWWALYNDTNKSNARLRDLSARKSALDGIWSGLITAAFNAALAGLSRERVAWWNHWQLTPPPRVPGFCSLETRLSKDIAAKVTHLRPRRFMRHRVDNSITDLSTLAQKFPPVLGPHAEQLPKEGQTGIRAYDNFITALKAAPQPMRPVNLGRRIITIGAQKGLGKGTFMSAFTTEFGFEVYRQALWSGTEHDPDYLTASYINLSFGSEIGSVLDSMTSHLEDAVAMAQAAKMKLHTLDIQNLKNVLQDFCDAPDNFEISVELNNSNNFKLPDGRKAASTFSARETFGECFVEQRDILKTSHKDIPRLSHLRRMMQAWKTASEALRECANNALNLRLLICINGVDKLYHPGPICKNREIEEVLNWLLSIGDMSCADVPVDLIFIGDDSGFGPPFAPSLEGTQGTKFETARQSFAAPIHLWVDPPHIRQKEKLFYRNHSSRFDFSDPLGQQKNTPTPDHAIAHQQNWIHFARDVNPAALMIDNFLPLAIGFMYLAEDRKRRSETAIALEEINLRERVNGAPAEWTLHHLQDQINNRWAEPSAPDPSIDFAKYIMDFEVKFCFQVWKCLSQRELNRTNWNTHTLRRLMKNLAQKRHQKLSGTDKRDWDFLETALRGNRYCLTILLAAAQRVMLGARTLREGAEAATQLILDTINEIRGASELMRERLVIKVVLQAYRDFHIIGDEQDDFELGTLILRHLSVINAPISADVVVRMPEIREYFNRIKIEVEISRKRRIVSTLTSLSDRGLVFRLAPHHRIKDDYDASWHAHLMYRYAVHSTLQEVIVSNMGITYPTPRLSNSFAPSLYASMPAELPRLSYEAYEFMRVLIASLSQYPDIDPDDRLDPTWRYSVLRRGTRTQALRAAMCAVRATFSVSVISRLEDHITPITDPAPHKRGFLEAYRVQLRWLIRKAWELLDADEKETLFAQGQKPDKDRLLALYRDEIVWLYNETGVVCLVQGNLRDAVALFRQAIQNNQEIEGKDDIGPRYNRISLNLAIVQIERGRVGAARSRLETIRKVECEVNTASRIGAIAQGYLGLCDHLAGNENRARENYKAALQTLSHYGDTRAEAVFCNHLARLEASDKNYDSAQRYVRQGLEFAEAGGHEDLRHRLLLSKVRVDLEMAEKPTLELQMVVKQRTVEVENYAQLMQAPSLKVEALQTRAAILLDQGETIAAGQLLIRAMALSRRNSMSLRLAAAMTSYARVLMHRRRVLSAERLLFAALDIAKRSEYLVLISRIQEVFDDLDKLPRINN